MKKMVLLGLLLMVGLVACGPVTTTTTTRDLAKQPSPCDPVLERDTLIDTGELQDPALQSEAYKNRPAFIVYVVDGEARCVPVGGASE